MACSPGQGEYRPRLRGKYSLGQGRAGRHGFAERGPVACSLDRATCAVWDDGFTQSRIWEGTNSILQSWKGAFILKQGACRPGHDMHAVQ